MSSESFITFNNNTLTVGSFSVTFSLSGIVEILIFSILCYYVIIWFKQSKAWNLLKGAAMLFIIYIMAKWFGLDNLAFVFENFVSYLILAVIIILQPEIRRALESLGTKRFTGIIPVNQSSEYAGHLTNDTVTELTRALSSLAHNRIGALIIIEKEILLDEYIETGIELDAVITTALLEQIFEHNTPLHDGAVIIRNNRIISATCYLPLSQNTSISKELGTRHRAGLGISEVSDCITLIASEETGAISIAMNGQLERNVTIDRVRSVIVDSGKKEERQTVLNRLFRRRKHNG